MIGFATYLLHVHDAASSREVIRGNATLDPALNFEDSSLWRARVGVNQVSVCVWVRDEGPWTRGIWRGAADPLTLRRLSSSASFEEGILKGNPIIVMRDRGCAPKCRSRRGSLRGWKCTS